MRKTRVVAHWIGQLLGLIVVNANKVKRCIQRAIA